jgi:hypothetical protein
MGDQLPRTTDVPEQAVSREVVEDSAAHAAEVVQ